MSDEESELLTQNEALDRPLALTFLFLQDSHFKILGRFGLGGRLVAGRFGVPKVCIIFQRGVERLQTVVYRRQQDHALATCLPSEKMKRLETCHDESK
jgi:hypothetical protein